ncbi:MAG: hypothetical protein J0L84_19310 [Verrucomicrobia bacterium]|nr:hypothetical protein [Verrucomicrobiota bacterium]
MRQQAGVLLNPKNLLRTVAGQFPIASIATELMDQIEGHETERRIESLEADVKSLARLKALEDASLKTPAPFHDWSIPAGEYLRRTVDVAVVYDGSFRSRADRGRELIQVVGHGCIVGDREVLVCKEALDLAHCAAEHKHGKVIMLVEMAWYEFSTEAPDSASGLSVCRLTARDEAKWQRHAESWREHGLGELKHDVISTPARFSVSPWMGQEIGFIHSGEADDVLRGRDSFSKLQFDASVISHFRRPSDGGLKIFVTGVLPGRVLQAGSPVFGRDGTLLGILPRQQNLWVGGGSGKRPSV